MTLGQTVLPYLSVTAISTTVCLFLCGLQICQRIRSRGTTDGTGSAPFLIGFVSCAFWLEYGLVKEDTVVIFTNCIGICMQAAYLSYYYRMTRSKKMLNRVVLAELVCICCMMYYVNWSNASRADIESHLGVVCILLNIATIGAPLFEVGEVIRSKSSEALPLPLCIACFLVSVQWLLYGIIVDDMVIQIPNYIATAISMLQLSLFVIYPRSRKYSRMGDDGEHLNI